MMAISNNFSHKIGFCDEIALHFRDGSMMAMFIISVWYLFPHAILGSISRSIHNCIDLLVEIPLMLPEGQEYLNVNGYSID